MEKQRPSLGRLSKEDWLIGRGFHGSGCQQAEPGARATHRFSLKLESHMSGGAMPTYPTPPGGSGQAPPF